MEKGTLTGMKRGCVTCIYWRFDQLKCFTVHPSVFRCDSDDQTGQIV